MSNAIRRLPRAAPRNKRFTPVDACRYHEAASLVPRRFRQAWARAANDEFARSHDEAAAIEMGNFELNCCIDEREVAHRVELIRMGEEQGLLPVRADSLGRLPEEVVDAGAGEEFVFIRHGEDTAPYVTGKNEVGRYLTLTNTAGQQRRAAGQPH
jgi:hypothetical protein